MGNVIFYRKQQGPTGPHLLLCGELLMRFLFILSFKVALYLAKLARDKAFLK